MTAARLGARLWWGLIALVVLLAGAGALGAPAVGVPVAPLLTQVLLPVSAFAVLVGLALTCGCALALLLRPQSRARRWLSAWSVVTLALVVIQGVLLVADVAASSALSALSSGAGEVITQTSAGRALLLQAVCLLLVAVLSAGAGARGVRIAILALALVAAASVGLASHVGLTGQHWAAGVAIAGHVTSVLLWVGGLSVVVAMVAWEPASAPRLLPAFSAVALACVIVAAECGLMAATLTTGTLGSLLGSTYGSIVIVKAAALVWLARWGWLQRRRVIDRLPDLTTVGTLTRFAGAELLVMGGLLGASVVLVRLGPPPLPAAGFAPLTLVSLAVIAPLGVVAMWPRGWRPAQAAPEVVLIIGLVVMVEVGGVGLLRTALGGAGLLIEFVLLVGLGWLMMSSVGTSRVARGIALVGIPAAVLACVVLPAHAPLSMAIAASVLADAVLLLWWRYHAPARIASIAPAGVA